jgi:hypothetical protein
VIASSDSLHSTYFSLPCNWSSSLRSCLQLTSAICYGSLWPVFTITFVHFFLRYAHRLDLPTAYFTIISQNIPQGNMDEEEKGAAIARVEHRSTAMASESPTWACSLIDSHNSPRGTMDEEETGAAIARVENRSIAMTSESPTSSFPFLKLPAELRVYIYRELLSRRLTSIHAYRQARFDPAILRANKQVFAEASHVLYTENDFIVLRVSTHEGHSDTRGYKWEEIDPNHFPNLAGLSENQIPNPLMRIAITELNRCPHSSCSVNERTFIFTVESLPHLISLLWGASINSDFYSSAVLTVSLFNKCRSRHTLLNTRVLRSLDQLQGFTQCSISGDVDRNVVRHITDCIILGPQLKYALFRVEELFSHGEHYFKNKNYNLARRYWGRMRRFWGYRCHFHSLPTRYHPKDFLEATLPFMLEGELRTRLIELRLKNYASLTYTAHAHESFRSRTLCQIVECMINKYSLSYRIPPALRAKFWFSESIGLYALGKKELSKQAHFMAVRSLCQDVRYAGKVYQVSLALEWARNRYFKQHHDPFEHSGERRTQ